MFCYPYLVQARTVEKPHSLWTNWRPHIEAMHRNILSKATATDDFAKQVVDAVLRTNPPVHLCIGAKSWIFKIARHFPVWLKDAIMARAYQLHKIQPSTARQPVEKQSLTKAD